ncbi:KTSC domain-containing protein [Delftia sp. GW456-R20]|uniref:KTSC domain-containing protein n=1 Tax=Delftia sp. GW456-R20 TaxID=1827145 RepID=UPI0007AECEBB|nr:KTSC domain-containing protein [Delftia sp. GW456-R20]KZK32034.1 KTSC domain-containing protein [Delftia sp. GW456-R20]
MATKRTDPAAFSDKEYKAIPMTPVQSNQIATMGYDAARKTLALTFTRGPGHVYHYPNVAQKTHDELMAAESKGVFFGQHIKQLPFDKFPAPEKAA